MRFIVFVRATEESETGVMPTAQLLEEMGEFNKQLCNAGIMKAGDGFYPTSKCARVSFSGKDRTVRKGPFPVNETIAGYWLWENLGSLDEAIEWVKRCPNPMSGPSEIEIRPLYEMEDFA
jgi:hypothetical protein